MSDTNVGADNTLLSKTNMLPDDSITHLALLTFLNLNNQQDRKTKAEVSSLCDINWMVSIAF